MAPRGARNVGVESRAAGHTSREEAGDSEGVRDGVAAPVPSTRHWKMLASLPPSETRYASSCVNRTLVTWLPWPANTRLGAWAGGGRVKWRSRAPPGPSPGPPSAPAADLSACARVLEEVHFAEVVGHGHHALVVRAAQGVDVRPV